MLWKKTPTIHQKSFARSSQQGHLSVRRQHHKNYENNCRYHCCGHISLDWSNLRGINSHRTPQCGSPREVSCWQHQCSWFQQLPKFEDHLPTDSDVGNSRHQTIPLPASLRSQGLRAKRSHRHIQMPSYHPMSLMNSATNDHFLEYLMYYYQVTHQKVAVNSIWSYWHCF